MDTLLQLLDFVLHVDRYLEAFVENYGTWVYALLFLIIFVETGLVVMPFLPGDSLLFVVGTLCGTGLMDLKLVMALLLLAAIAGDQVNYRIGRYFGPKVFQWESSRFFNRAAFDKAHNFYETYGGITIVLARFMPFIRTFPDLEFSLGRPFARQWRIAFKVFLQAFHQRIGHAVLIIWI